MPKLPPSERDFDIYEAVHIAGYPTRDEAQKYGISQTRVRQIVRRVVEWLGEVIPPQAKIAKEQQSHLARQIAADRFNLQYAEASTNWYQSGELKFASLRIRLTHAQARLGVPGSLIGGLAADAIEGIPVPIWEGEAREGEAPAEPTQARSASEGTGSNIVLHPETALLDDQPDPDPPVIYCDPIAWDKLTPEIIAARQAAGRPIHQFLIQYAIDHGVLPQPNAANDQCPSPPTPDSPLSAPSANPQSEIRNPQFASTPHSPSPPLRDFSHSNKNSAGREATIVAQSNQTSDASDTYDDNTARPTPAAQPATAPSEPLLTTNNPLPVTELQLAPNQPAATLSPTTSASPPLASLSPCSPTPDP
jgi:hypothetical protein